MSKNLSPIRPAMTAIAAVMALSSTSVLAQTTDSTIPAAPVVVAPPPPTVTAPPAAPDISAPAPAAAPAAPAPAMKTVGTPVVHDADAATTPSASEGTVVSTRTAPAKRISTAPAARTSAPVATVSVTPAKVHTAPAPHPAAVAKTTPAPAETTPAAAPAPAATVTRTTHATSADETLPIAGGVGLAVIALGAAAFAMRRRRDERDETVVTEPASVETVAVPEAAPAVTAPKAVAPAPIAAAGMPRTLPNGFDISRFGRHTQAAYLGPTPDNPSYSLKRRLKRASFFDQREREAAAAGHPVAQTPIEAPVQQAARTAQDDGQVTVRLAPQRKSRGFGYIFQR